MKYPGSLNKPASEDDFVFYSSDQKGHHATLPKVAIPPELDQLMSEMLVEGKFPYRTRQDIVRDALYHRLEWACRNQAMGHGDLLQRLRAIDEIVKNEQAGAEYLQRMESIGKVVGMVSDSPEHQRYIVNSFEREIRRMPDGYWKSRYMKNLGERYSHLLDKALSINPKDAVDDDQA